MAAGFKSAARRPGAGVQLRRAWPGFTRLRALTPSRGSLVAGLLLALAGAGAYATARETSAFAVQRVEVRGARGSLPADVRGALAPVVGRSLLELDGADVERRVASLPFVAGVEYDRAFPHTLVVTVQPERQLAVVRSGGDAWLVSARGRVLEALPRGARPALPRVWMRMPESLAAGAFVTASPALRAVAGLNALADQPLPVGVRSVRADGRELTLLLATGLEVRLVDTARLRLKLAVAGCLVAGLVPPRAGGPAYLDLTVPKRPVLGGSLNPKVEVQGLGSACA